MSSGWVDEAIGTADVVVVDAHGVVFDRAFPAFVRQRAIERGDEPGAVWRRWLDEERQDFWEGRTTPAELWASLFPGDSPGLLTATLERSYRPGPLYDFVASGDRPMWLLSNHRSGWLLPRLERFGLADRFERVLVSDQLGAAKPDPAAFEPLRRAGRSSSVCLLDDSPVNVEAARGEGIEAHLVVPLERRPDAAPLRRPPAISLAPPAGPSTALRAADHASLSTPHRRTS